MLKKAVLFVVTHKLASAAFLLPFVGVAAAVAILAFQRQRDDRLPAVRDAADEPVAPPMSAEMDKAMRLDFPWLC